jgi:hypothetical protein
VATDDTTPSADPADDTQPDPPTRSYVIIRAGVMCLQCGRRLGFLQRVTDHERSSASVFYPEGTEAAAGRSWRSVHCPTCGGVPIVEDYEAVRHRVEDIDWSLDRPRRGRPSKWLVQQRLRDRA